MNAKTEIEQNIDKIHKIGRAEIIRLARKVLRKHDKPQIFTMAMGVYTFEDENGDNMYVQYCNKELDDFLCCLDNQFGFTGWPLRITKDLQIDGSY